MKFNARKFAARLRSSGLNQKEFATAAGIHYTKLSQYLTGYRDGGANPRPKRIVKFAQVLGCTPEELCDLNNEEVSPLAASLDAMVTVLYDGEGVIELRIDGHRRWGTGRKKKAAAKAEFVVPRGLAEHLVTAFAAGMDVANRT